MFDVGEGRTSSVPDRKNEIFPEIRAWGACRGGFVHYCVGRCFLQGGGGRGRGGLCFSCRLGGPGAVSRVLVKGSSSRGAAEIVSV